MWFIIMFCSYKNCFISKTSFEWIKIIPKPLFQGVTMFQVIIRLVEQFKFSLMRYYCSKMIIIRSHQNAQKWPISIKNDHHRIQRRIKFAQKRPNFTSIRKKMTIFLSKITFFGHILTFILASKFWSRDDTSKTSNSWSESGWTNIWTTWLFKRIDWNNKKDEKSKRDSRSDVIGDSAI